MAAMGFNYFKIPLEPALIIIIITFIPKTLPNHGGYSTINPKTQRWRGNDQRFLMPPPHSVRSDAKVNSSVT